ncbi:MAG: hypothetical protein QNM02_00710 [Acidimicrobiia bacterium]|nr:hypothetical protein [Acidimicrobiia bacterium]
MIAADTMHLVLTQYIDAETEQVAGALEQAIRPGLEAAADRIGAGHDPVATAPLAGGIRVDRGLEMLVGSEVHVSGTDRLTTLEFTVPWTTADRDGKKLLASNAFANTVAAQLDGEVATAA